MSKQKFHIDEEWDGNHGSTIHFDGYIELDDIVINQVDDEWRKQFYSLKTPQQIAEHIAYNLIVNEIELSDLEGFANLSDDMAKIL